MFVKLKLLIPLLSLLCLLGCRTTRESSNARYGVKAISGPGAYSSLIAADSSKSLVELKDIIPDIQLDIRYAGRDNFMRRRMYSSAHAFLSLPAATALRSVQEELKLLGYGLKVYDAYRPYSVTVAFYEKVHDTVFVASAYRGSRHNRACAVDVSLIDLNTGKEVLMPTAFDDFSERAHSSFTNLPAEAIRNRELLKETMTRHGFDVLASEWWHFDFKNWKDHPILDISFRELLKLKQ